MTVHWCGTGLSAVPGLRKLLADGYDVTVWNRTVEKAKAEVGDLTNDIRAFDLETLAGAVAPGDVVVSMLPGDLHVPLAKICLDKGANFVSSSYIAPEMRALDAKAKEAGLALVNECGLDPGIDHLMAHYIVADYKASEVYDPANALSFLSYCGGIPKIPNPFRYKFSWSPVGVLRALRSPSKSIRGGKEFVAERPWNALGHYTAPLPEPERFEVYPNRDSLPFMQDYAFQPDWTVETFARGTLRLDGWAEAWKDVFAEIETLEGAEGDARLKEMSDGFWAENSYDEGEPDRVVLCVDLEAKKDGKAVYHKSYVMDAWGDENGTAMARLVSIPVALAVMSVLDGKIAPGVSPAPSSPELYTEWLDQIAPLAQHFEVVDQI